MIFVPTGIPPYRAAPVAPAAHRVAMLRLALAGEARYAIDERELAHGASGYTVDTLASLRAEHGPEQPLFLLMGADQHSRLGTWHRWQELSGLCRIAVFARPGWKADSPGAEHVPMEPLAISASEIRARIRRGADIAALVPAPVAAYIRERGLYR